MRNRRIKYTMTLSEKIEHLVERFLYYYAGVGGGLILGGIGFGIGMEFWPYRYIAPILLSITGFIIGFAMFKGARIRPH